MMGKTHLLIGGSAWLAALAVTSSFHASLQGITMLAGGWALAAVGALAPDIDSRGSTISRSLGPITGALSWVIRKIGAIGDPSAGYMRGHRRVTHSLIGSAIAAIPFVLGVALWHLQPWVLYAFMIGWVSHVLADMMTVWGCPLLWPRDKCYGLHWLKTGSDGELYLVHLPALFANFGLLCLLIWKSIT